MIGTSQVTVRAATKDDTIGIANMLRDEGLSLPPFDKPELVMQHWERLWDDNPYYKEFNESVFYGWVLTDGDSIVGFFGYMPRVYYLHGKKITVQVSTNWGIHKQYRRFAYSLCDAMFNGCANDLKITTTAITQTGKIFSMFQSKRYPDNDFEHAYVIPLRLDKVVKQKFESRVRAGFIPAIGFIARCLNPLLPVVLKSRFLRWNNLLEQITIDALPDDFELFWEQCLEQSTGLIASRSPATMKWVYADVKKEDRKRIFLYRNAATKVIEGYASLILEPVVSYPELKRYKVGDLLFLTDEAKACLLKGLISYALEDRADVLEVHLVASVKQTDIPAYTIQRKTASFPVYFHTTNTELEAFLLEKGSWHFTPYDGDTILG